jgi:gamma-glutamyltranspeptidase/glutathione hydrolase
MFGSQRTSGGAHASARSMVIAPHGAACTSQPLASAAALAMLRAGGNAIDAAVTAAAVQGVVEPYNTGIGGDCLMLAWTARERKLHALNGTGRAPARATLDEYRRRGLAEVPPLGILAVTVPGAVDAWCEALERLGTRTLADVLAPAIAYAEDGFPVSEVIAREWGLVVRAGWLGNDDARRCFAPGGEPPGLGQLVRLPELARTLRLLADGGRDAFYRGEIADRLARFSAANDGLLTRDDLEAHRSTWVEPLTTSYRGHRLVEMPPSTQGIAALIALNVLECFDVPALAPGGADALHLRIEAMKLAFADRGRFVADPEHVAVPVAGLLDKGYARERARLIDRSRALPGAAPGTPALASETVYLTVADAEGNVVSFINSLFGAFGSGLVAGDTGIALQNRGRGFVLDPAHPNCIAPGKRPFHTLIPAMLLDDAGPRVSFGVMGGDVQAQGHLQVVSNLVDHELNVQEALDAPRFHVLAGNEVALEDEFPSSVKQRLLELGHAVSDPIAALLRGGFGGGQAIAIDPATGCYWAASDRRKDGCAVGY